MAGKEAMDKETTPQPVAAPSGSALVRAARRCQRIANQFQAADAELKRQMEARYGEHDELPDPIVEITQYGSYGQPITIKWLDAEMAREGYSPNTERSGGTSAPVSG